MPILGDINLLRSGSILTSMATNPLPNPIEEEAQRLLDQNPQLLARLERIQHQLDAGEYQFRDNHDEARRIAGLDPRPTEA